MSRPLIITFILLTVITVVTVAYFKNLHVPGQQAAKVMSAIPAGAVLVFEYKNEQEFYELLSKDSLVTSLIGPQKASELSNLKTALLQSPALKVIFEGQSIFVSIHPQKDSLDFLITTSANRPLTSDTRQLERENNANLSIEPTAFGNKPGWTIELIKPKAKVYVINQGEGVFSLAFSRSLINEAARYRDQKHNDIFMQMTDQEDANSIANLYVNYLQLGPLLDVLFKSKNNDIFSIFSEFPAVASLTLNYKSDALMFSGVSHISGSEPKSYLSLFKYQQPTVNKLKDIFPASTAYSVNFAASDPVKFENNLSQWQQQTGVNTEKNAIFTRIRREKQVDLSKEFLNDLGNEFAIITTKYQEKLAIVQLKNGALLRPTMVNISTMINADAGQLDYDKLPLFLLGDAFGIFRRPYFIIADNYLIFCGSQTGLMEYYRNYTKGNFISNDDNYRRFDNLQAEKSNVSFFMLFKNSQALLKAGLEPAYAEAFATKSIRWNKYYAAAYQFTAADNNFYTNFYMRLNMEDTVAVGR